MSRQNSFNGPHPPSAHLPVRPTTTPSTYFLLVVLLFWHVYHTFLNNRIFMPGLLCVPCLSRWSTNSWSCAGFRGLLSTMSAPARVACQRDDGLRVAVRPQRRRALSASRKVRLQQQPVVSVLVLLCSNDPKLPLLTELLTECSEPSANPCKTPTTPASSSDTHTVSVTPSPGILRHRSSPPTSCTSAERIAVQFTTTHTF